MSLDLLDSLSTALAEPRARELASLLDEPETNTRTTLQLVSATVFTALLQQAKTPAGSASVFNALQDQRLDYGPLSKVSASLDTRPTFDALRGLGESLLSTVLGTRAGALANAISRVAGVKPNSALSLLSVAVALVMGILRKRTTALDLDAAGVAALLLAQRGALEGIGLDMRVVSALDPGNLTGLLKGTPATSVRARASTRSLGEAHEPRRNWVPWMILIANIALLLLVLIYNAGERTDRPDAASAAREKALRLAAADKTKDYASDSMVERTGQRTLADPPRAEIVSRLQQQLGLNDGQVRGGLGALLVFARTRLPKTQFDELAASIPNAAHIMREVELRGIVTPLDTLDEYEQALSRLGIDQPLAAQFAPAVLDELSATGHEREREILARVID